MNNFCQISLTSIDSLEMRLTLFGDQERIVSCLALNPLTHFVIVRNDLPLGLLSAQIVHAAGESTAVRVPPGTYAIVLAVPDEKTLLELHVKLLNNNVDHSLIYENDEPYRGQAMAIGVLGLRQTLRRYFGFLPAFKR